MPSNPYPPDLPSARDGRRVATVVGYFMPLPDANYIIANGAPTTGFPIGNVKRVDIGAAMTAALPRYTIAGQVVDMDWQPVIGAEVMLEGVGSQITTTGGTFSFTSVINGTYSVSVIATTAFPITDSPVAPSRHQTAPRLFLA